MKINFLNVDLFNRARLKKVLSHALKKVGQPDDVELSVSFVTEEEIKALNNQHRGIDAVTDVLSFPSAELTPFQSVAQCPSADKNPYTDNFLLGDVIICTQKAKQQAKAFGHSVKREIAFLALHGFLHLCGFDHLDQPSESQMQSLAESVLTSLNVKR